MSLNAPTRYLLNGTQILILSHSIFWLATNLLSSFLGVFFINELHDVTLSEVGISSLIFFLSFGLLEPIVGFVADRITGLKDEIYFVVFGYIARGVIFILFAWATNAWHLYMFQFFLGVFRALSSPADKVLYSKYLRGRESATLWGLDESFINLSAALGAGTGGYFISIYGFRNMFILVGLLTIVAGLVNYPILLDLSKKKKRK